MSLGLGPTSSTRTGSLWTILTKLPVAFWAGRRASEAPVPGLKPVTRAREDLVGVGVDVEVDGVADPDRLDLGLLEVAVDPDLLGRADGHQPLALGDAVAGVDVAVGDEAVDVGEDLAVAEVEVGLGQVLLGLLDPRAGADSTAGALATVCSIRASMSPSGASAVIRLMKSSGVS